MSMIGATIKPYIPLEIFNPLKSETRIVVEIKTAMCRLSLTLLQYYLTTQLCQALSALLRAWRTTWIISVRGVINPQMF